jgi:hypothetical protein
MINDISQAVESLVNAINPTIYGVYLPAPDEFTTVCNTKWARIGKTITDSQNDTFLITDIEYDNWIKAGIIDGEITLPTPYFVPGTKIEANREWTISTNDLTQKTPLVWLLHGIRYNSFGKESVFAWESDLRIFFLDETDILNFYTKDHIQQVVIPMTKLAEEFLKVVDQNKTFLRVENYEIIEFSRFGTEQENGYFKNILDANLSGVELRVKLTKYKENCKC